MTEKSICPLMRGASETRTAGERHKSASSVWTGKLRITFFSKKIYFSPTVAGRLKRNAPLDNKV